MNDDRILEALDGLTTPDPSPELYARIQERVRARGRDPGPVAPPRLAAALAGLALLVALNVGVAVASVRAPETSAGGGDPYSADLASDYTLYEP